MKALYQAAQLVVFILWFGAALCVAQAPIPQPTPPNPGPQEKVTVFTEEVVIPVSAYDTSGHLNPFLEPQDIIVFEDDVQQLVRSVRRLPANVFLMLDTAGEMNPAMRISTTREIATGLASALQPSDHIAVLQFGGQAQLIQDWTTDKEKLLPVLKTKLSSGKRSSLANALLVAAAQLKQAPAGSRHLVLITDGVESSGEDALAAGIKQLLALNVTVHVISYTAIGRKTIDKQNPLVKVTNKKRKSAKDIADEIMNPPTQQSEWRKRKKIYVIVDTDIAMRRKRGDYKEATKQSEKWLSSLAVETGGVILLPGSVKEMITRSNEVAREIDSQYVVTYTPKRPLAAATQEEYRQLKVASRRMGLEVHARRGYIAMAQ